MNENILVGVSSCLLGEPVRYDGGHKLDRYVRDTLGHYFRFVPVCPETECGLGVPREAMRLVGDPTHPRLVTNKTGMDHTERMLEYSARRVEELAELGLCGFIFKSKSPSSGMERVKIYNDSGIPAATGVGLFARAFMDRFPLIPVEEEGRLHDDRLRENFIERIFTLRRWQQVREQADTDNGWKHGPLVEFHERHKFLLSSHSPKITSELGKIVAEAGKRNAETLYQEYQTGLMQAMRLLATTAKHVNVLQHIMGFFKKFLTPDEKTELIETIEQYRQQIIPLIVVTTLLNHYVRKYDVSYLKTQFYLHPHPLELKLRNHV
ncbi:YbgA family protein [Desulfovibrio inopinatus]|uniref:YbgA family protein n=1 Tax=Desulfovibrio inopinatus TaxID=102109 RepID=UPI000405770B|nr:DUF523 and DUF1722 domain-containing protein [Desulfovibrio inopinatus]